MSPPAVLTPTEVLQLWHRQLGHDSQFSRVIAFANELMRTLSTDRIAVRSPLSDLNLPNRTHNALRRAGYDYIDEIEHLPPAQLGLLKHIGETSIRCIRKALKSWRRAREADEATSRELEPNSFDPETIQSLEAAFYSGTSDQQRMAALLSRAADLIGPAGANDLREMAVGLLDANAIATRVG